MVHSVVRASTSLAASAAVLWWLSAAPAPRAQSADAVRTLRASEAGPDLLRREVDAVRRLESDRNLRVAAEQDDPIAPGHRHERLQQYHLGLEVAGGSVLRQTANGVVTSLFGQLFRTDQADATPALSRAAITTRLGAGGDTPLITPELVFVGLDDGGARLAWRAHVQRTTLDARTLYLDAETGAVLRTVPLVKDQAAVGEGLGVLNDRKKVGTRQAGSVFFAEDLLRPPQLWTVDVRGNRDRFIDVVNGAPVALPDLASDSDNVWTDAVAVDAHAYLGWTYDFIFKRLGVRGLDGNNAPMVGSINLYSPVQCVGPLPADDFGLLCVNAFWAGPPAGPGGRGLMYFGNGIPSNFLLTSSGQTVGPLAGALDVVAHELTHGVTDFTSQLEYEGESGALNEAFSDMMGTAVEAFFQPRGSNLLQADYVIGEDTFRPLRAGSVAGFRSMQSPTAFGHPDHYSQRYTGPEDSGGVHRNSGIANHAFYLAIEGGTHRLSGVAVSGVGFGNREQIERVFFRAFTRLLPPRATFSQARAATIQSARDLYPSNGAVERAVTDAWTAVGVQ